MELQEQGGLKELVLQEQGGLKEQEQGGLKELQEQGGLKELVLLWFSQTQAQILPDWFQGFAARREAEDLLREKPRGCFLVRLSEKAVGYILSYRGHDRCRHFVITQDPYGQFVISGDCQTFQRLTELIEHYRLSPIQPFGEHLTCSCNEEEELYDVVNYKTKEKTSRLSVQALRILWDQRSPRLSTTNRKQREQQQHEPVTVQPPDLPIKSKSRQLTGTVSDTTSPSQVAPPLPRRGFPPGFSLSGSLPETTSQESEAQSSSTREEALGGDSTTDSFHTTSPAGNTSSELTQTESRSQALPQLESSSEEEEVTCSNYFLHDPSRPRPLYQASEGQTDVLYAQVAERPSASGPPDDTYEQIPREAGPPSSVQSNTYESLEDMKTKKSKSSWGKNNMKWKKFFPEYKKK
ncbi:SH2 domain-containing protein 7 [Limanda limanda]|uniref:SH2 domain-containing protein 7 n=1 Tax=Limanda limanda TaxID=27771 RepID=UPI0029C75517|nr:SH2 domain-containing protein 7 [Limanda limanda]